MADEQSETGGVEDVRNFLADRPQVGLAEVPAAVDPVDATELTAIEAGLLSDLFAVVAEHAHDETSEIDRDQVEFAFSFACEHHADQRRKSGEEFIHHPVGVAKICAGMRLDTETLCAALLHDTVEDTSASIEEVREQFGEEVALLVDGVTKIGGISFQSRDEAQAENFRKMIVAMSSDIRVILIKLADRLHNMRTIEALPKHKQIEKARETIDVYAPIAHRLGIHAIKWELEDLAFQALHPRKYNEIKELVSQQRNERERFVAKAAGYLSQELEELGIEAEIAGRAKHFYSIHQKMTRKGREFNEIYDLTAMRVVVESVKDTYGAVGVIHSLWKPLPGRFKDFIAMPKANLYQSLHTTVVGPEGRPLEIQIRTREMHETAEFGVAAHWLYKQQPGQEGPHAGPEGWVSQLADWQKDTTDPREFMEGLRVDLFEDEVFVFTPKGEVKSIKAGATPLDFAYEIHTEVGHRCVGAKVNGKIVPLHYELKSGDICEILTSKRERGPSRDWLSLVKTNRARNRISAFLRSASRSDAEHTGRELLQKELRRQGLPAQKIVGASLLVDVLREMGFKKADDFYIALGSGKVGTQVVVNKVMQRLKQGEAAESAPTGAELLDPRTASERQTTPSTRYGITVKGVDDVMLRLAKCCRPVPGDSIVGYISLGRGITIHRTDCSNAVALGRTPERFVEVGWGGEGDTAFKVELEVHAHDRHRLLEDLSRSLSESGLNILEAKCSTGGQMVRNSFIVEVPDKPTLDQAVTRLRQVDSVFDAYRVTPQAS